MVKNVDENKCPRAIDVFSGCGGLTLGLRQAGFDVIAAIELDEKASSVYSSNHPETKLYKMDVRDVSGLRILDDFRLKVGELELLAGCPPCQGFSRIRRRNKQALGFDPRNLLIDDFARLVFQLRPKLVMMENVPALRNYHRFRKFVASLERHGYFVEVKTLNTIEYGVPQRRDRLILVASIECRPLLALPIKKKATVFDAIGNLPKPGLGSDELHNIIENRTERVKRIIENIPHDGGSRKNLPDEMTLSCHRRSDGFSDVYGRMAWGQPAPTITSGCSNPSKGRFLHPDQDRCITLREASLLQGFPKNYIFESKYGKEALALMIGNALPPHFVKLHAKSLLNSISNDYHAYGI